MREMKMYTYMIEDSRNRFGIRCNEVRRYSDRYANAHYWMILVSDRAYSGESIDKSGPLLRESLQLAHYNIVETSVVPDSIIEIQKVVEKWCTESVNLIITTGGTGFAPRDLTPEVSHQLFLNHSRRLDLYCTKRLPILSKPCCSNVFKLHHSVLYLEECAAWGIQHWFWHYPAVPKVLLKILKQSYLYLDMLLI